MWFVYAMARKVTTNESRLESILREIQTKLQLLGEATDCPVCLESISADAVSGEAGVALGCAHKLHADCWRHWSAHCANRHKPAFCPLCRNDEFLEDILV